MRRHKSVESKLSKIIFFFIHIKGKDIVYDKKYVIQIND